MNFDEEIQENNFRAKHNLDSFANFSGKRSSGVSIDLDTELFEGDFNEHDEREANLAKEKAQDRKFIVEQSFISELVKEAQSRSWDQEVSDQRNDNNEPSEIDKTDEFSIGDKVLATISTEYDEVQREGEIKDLTGYGAHVKFSSPVYLRGKPVRVMHVPFVKLQKPQNQKEAQIRKNDFRDKVYEFLDKTWQEDTEIEFIDLVTKNRSRFERASASQIQSYLKNLYQENESDLVNKVSESFLENLRELIDYSLNLEKQS